MHLSDVYEYSSGLRRNFLCSASVRCFRTVPGWTPTLVLRLPFLDCDVSCLSYRMPSCSTFESKRNRYLDCSTNSIKQTVAMAHPDTPASKLFEMARSIEANITIKSADWLKCKLVPK